MNLFGLGREAEPPQSGNAPGVEAMLARGVSLEYALLRGQEITYRATTRISQDVLDGGQLLGSQKSSWEAVLTHRILEVDPDGCGHVLLVSEPTTDQPQGESLGPPLTRQVLYVRMDARGRVLDVAGLQGPTLYRFPDEDVRHTSTWTSESQVPFPMLGQAVTIHNHYHVETAEVLHGFECVRIGMRSDETHFEAPLPDGSKIVKVMVESQGVLHFAPQEGVVVRLETKTHSVPKIGAAVYDTTTTFIQEFMGAREHA